MTKNEISVINYLIKFAHGNPAAKDSSDCQNIIFISTHPRPYMCTNCNPTVEIKFACITSTN